MTDTARICGLVLFLAALAELESAGAAGVNPRLDAAGGVSPRRSRYVTEPPIGASCDGSTDDSERLTAACAAGGEWVLPAFSTCSVGSDVTLGSSCVLRGEPGSVVRAAPGARFKGGIFTGSDVSHVGFHGVEIDLNGAATSAVAVSGKSQRITFENGRIHGGADRTGANHVLLRITCGPKATAAPCATVRSSVFDCAGRRNETGDSGLHIDSAGSFRSSIRDNLVNGCDGHGIRVGGRAGVDGNSVTAPGASAIALQLDGGNATASNNYVDASGIAAIGIVANAKHQTITGNGCVARGHRATCYRQNAAEVTWNGNDHQLGSDTSAFGYDIRSQFAAINGPTGESLGRTLAQQHIVIGRTGQTGQVQIAGGTLNEGFIGIGPTPAASGYGAINFRATGTTLFGQEYAGVICTTGCLVSGATITWQRGSCIYFGDDREYGTGSAHAALTGSHCHLTANASGPGVRFATKGRRCRKDAPKPWIACRSDSDCGAGGTCASVTISDFNITGNEILGGDSDDAIVGIGIGVGFDADSPVTHTGIVSGNTISLPGRASTCLDFPDPAFASKITNVTLGPNVRRCRTYRSSRWRASMGRDVEDRDG